MMNNYAMITSPTQSSTSKIEIEDRKLIAITGVKNVESFDSKEFLLHTNLGHLHLSGSDLTLEKMDLERGEVLIKGTINNLNYISSFKEGKKDGFVKRIFK